MGRDRSGDDRLPRREWGVPVHDDRVLFEFLILEGAQAGLSWSTILRKREGYRRSVPRGFDPAKVARFGERDVARLLADETIVRNAGEDRVVDSQRAGVSRRAAGSSARSTRFCGAYVDGEPRVNRPRGPGDVPARPSCRTASAAIGASAGSASSARPSAMRSSRPSGWWTNTPVTCFRAQPAPGGRRARGVSAR